MGHRAVFHSCNHVRMYDPKGLTEEEAHAIINTLEAQPCALCAEKIQNGIPVRTGRLARPSIVSTPVSE